MADPRGVVIGGGVAGLAAAHDLQRRAAAAGVAVACTVVEAAPLPGGKVVTERTGGFVVEGGPDSFLVHKPWARDLVEELGLGDRLVASNDARRRVFVVRRGRLVPVPDGVRLVVPTRLGPLLASPLLSWAGKLRMGLEWLVPARRPDPGDPDGGDESLAAFVRRRLGREALERLAGPIMAHVHLADPERLSMAATFPMFLEMERRHGGLLRALRAGRRPSPGAPSGAPLFLTLRGGMGELAETLAARIGSAAGGEILCGRRAVGLIPMPGRAGSTAGGPAPRWLVRLDDGRELPADAVVLALPAFAAAELTAAAAPGLAAALGRFRCVSAATVSLAYRRDELAHPLDGFGFFVPRDEGRRIVASTWSSTKFDGRAPADRALIRVFAGGAGGEEAMALGDDELVAAVREELSELMGIAAAPLFARVHRWERGYPQYDVGHLHRVAAAEASAPPGLILAGSAYHGVGIPDCIASGRRAAGRAWARLVDAPESAGRASLAGAAGSR